MWECVAADVRVGKAALELIRDEGLKASANAACPAAQEGRDEMVDGMKCCREIRPFQLSLSISQYNYYHPTMLHSNVCTPGQNTPLEILVYEVLLQLKAGKCQHW